MMESALDEAISMKIEESAEWARLLFITMRNRMKMMPDGILEVISHSGYARNQFDFHAAYVLAQCCSFYLDGRISITEINVGESPTKDADWEENRKRLSGINKRFRADVWGPTKIDSDGNLYIDGGVYFYGNDKTQAAPDVVPLEIGSTSAASTWFNVMQCRGVARWPYGHEKITLLCLSPDLDFGWGYETETAPRKRPKK